VLRVISSYPGGWTEKDDYTCDTAKENRMTHPRDMRCREQANYLRLEIINRFIRPMLVAGINNLLICAAMAEAAGSLCPAERDLDMLHAMVSKGFEDSQQARSCEKGTTH
jgi:hypothetical protein